MAVASISMESRVKARFSEYWESYGNDTAYAMHYLLLAIFPSLPPPLEIVFAASIALIYIWL